MNTNFVDALNEFQARVHDTAQDKGWWEQPREDGTLVALMHSELSELLEALRNCEGKERVAEELSDVVIRAFDFAEYQNIPLGKAMIDKARRNEGRSYRHGGKAF
ncbi:MAG: hypothetical protein AAGA75_14215 [Cyanobacteria bacterium P01_E01_bin.6]